MHQSSEADSSDTLEYRNKPDIRRPAAWLLGGQVDQLAWTERLMQQCRAGYTHVRRSCSRWCTPSSVNGVCARGKVGVTLVTALRSSRVATAPPHDAWTGGFTRTDVDRPFDRLMAHESTTALP